VADFTAPTPAPAGATSGASGGDSDTPLLHISRAGTSCSYRSGRKRGWGLHLPSAVPGGQTGLHRARKEARARERERTETGVYIEMKWPDGKGGWGWEGGEDGVTGPMTKQ
jgi:hypothetical protein